MEGTQALARVPQTTPPERGSQGAALARSVLGFFTRAAEMGVAFLNGLAGDTIASQQSHLAISMQMRRMGRRLPESGPELAEAAADLGPKVCVMVHGLCCTEAMFDFPGKPGVNYGSLLEEELGYSSLFVRYNTGLHISENGRALSRLLDGLSEAMGSRMEKLVIIGHSQGGLVARSACHYGSQERASWVEKTERVVLLGSPQLGAGLEKAVNVLSWVLGAVRTTATTAVSEFLNFRSAAIKDLRFGYLVDEEWRGRDPDRPFRQNRVPVPAPDHTSHYAAAATLTRDPDHPVSFVLGDILVRVPSALGCGPADEGERCPLSQSKVFPGYTHFDLARHPDVYEQIKEWLS
ncbi:MAG: alpha/beta hydrolase [Thermodesulfobacteriota bacterium]